MYFFYHTQTRQPSYQRKGKWGWRMLERPAPEKNINLIDNKKKFKFFKQISSVFNWMENYNSSLSLKECGSHASNIIQVNHCTSVLKSIFSDNLNKLILAHLNIISIRNKFELLSSQVKGNIDLLKISETKIDDSFHVGEFYFRRFQFALSVRLRQQLR